MKFPRWDYALRVRLPLLVFSAAAGFAGTYYFSRAERDGVGYAPAQPVAFSHRLHAGTMGIACAYCHTGAAVSRHAGVPPAAVCMNCHAAARKNRPEIVKLTALYEKGESPRWKRIHRVPDYAYFGHSVHVAKGIPCGSCHGPVENMEAVSQTAPFTMGACLDCHRNAPERLKGIGGIARGPEHCSACHR
ncbi:MAG: cytochrome c3 family protein [Bacteroidota bacterium]